MSNKLHPIYVALDNHQFSRAIKLCLAMPADNVVAQSLLVVAYAKNHQRYKALLALQGMIGTTSFPELQLEVKYSLESREVAPVPAPTRKTGKKGKKASSSAPKAQPAPSSNFDLVDQLDHPPKLPDDWNQPQPHSITDPEADRKSTRLNSSHLA